jgi:serine carboxypeptidase-like clade 1
VQLYDEISHAHILYKKCVYVSPRPNDGTTERKILKEETGLLKKSPPRPPMDCQTYGNYLSYFWANNNITRETLGIKKGSKDEWVRCHNGDLPYYKDIKSNIKYHNNMTTKGFRLLVYSGDHDAVVPFLGTQSWVRSLNFPVVDEWRAWHLDGQSAGFTITYTNNLTFATIKVTRYLSLPLFPSPLNFEIQKLSPDEIRNCHTQFSQTLHAKQLKT